MDELTAICVRHGLTYILPGVQLLLTRNAEARGGEVEIEGFIVVLNQILDAHKGKISDEFTPSPEQTQLACDVFASLSPSSSKSLRLDDLRAKLRNALKLDSGMVHYAPIISYDAAS